MVMQNFLPGFEEREPGAAFLQGVQRRLGFDPNTSIFGRFQAAQQRPFQNTFAFNQLLNPGATSGTPADNPFLTFAQNNNLAGVRNLARQNFDTLSASPFLSGGQSGIGSVIQQFQQPDEQQAGDLRDLAVTALMSRISPLALNLLNVPSGGALRDQFLAQTGGNVTDAAGSGNNFINFLRARLGLGLI